MREVKEEVQIAHIAPGLARNRKLVKLISRNNKHFLHEDDISYVRSCNCAVTAAPI